MGLGTIVSKHNSVSEKALRQSLQQHPWYPWKQILICIFLWTYTGAGREGPGERQRRGMTGGDGKQQRIVSVTSIYRPVRSQHPSPLRKLKVLQGDESSQCPEAEWGIPVISASNIHPCQEQNCQNTFV